MKMRFLTVFVLVGLALLAGPRLLGAESMVSALDGAKTTCVSVSSGGTLGNGDSENACISADGRYVAFYSKATNLVPGDANDAGDVFVHDRWTGQTTRVSVASDGTQGDSYSGRWGIAISARGRYVVFDSSASNLVPSDTNDYEDVFVHDRFTSQTTCVSWAPDGTPGNANAYYPCVSADGRYVAFQSQADNLLPGLDFGVHIFVHDQQTGEKEVVSVNSAGTLGDDSSEEPSISADGRYVAFQSQATNLVTGDTNAQQDIFVHDRETGQTTRVSVASDGTEGDDYSNWPDISGDGSLVVFNTEARTLFPGADWVWDVLLYDRGTGQTTLISAAPNGTQGNSGSWFATISQDGSCIAYDSWAYNLVPDDDNYPYPDIFVYDRKTEETTLVSRATDDTQGNGKSRAPDISGDGRCVVFDSESTNLVPNDTNEAKDVFVHERWGVPPPSWLYLPLALRG